MESKQEWLNRVAQQRVQRADEAIEKYLSQVKELEAAAADAIDPEETDLFTGLARHFEKMIGKVRLDHAALQQKFAESEKFRIKVPDLSLAR